MTEERAIRLAREWAFGGVCSLQEGEAQEYHRMALLALEAMRDRALPVVHGVWEYELQTINTYGMLKCSKCGWWTLDASVGDAYHFCPKCGAKMNLED